MSDPHKQLETQLRNIRESTGLSIEDFAKEIRAAGLEKHGRIVSFLKEKYGLGHGNANVVSVKARELLAGGPAGEDDLLSAQYEGAKRSLFPIYEALNKIAVAAGKDVQRIVQKTGVSYRRDKQFALVHAPSSKRVTLGLNLPATPAGGRVVETKGMCTHRVDLSDVSEIDNEVRRWISDSYAAAVKE